MKRIVFLALALLLVGTLAFGLDIAVGAKGAAGHSMFLGEDYGAYLDSFAGKRAFFLAYGGGVFATLSLMDALALQPEVLFLHIGGADVNEGVGTEYFICNYIAPAVVVKARFDMFNVFAGPAALIKIGTGKLLVKWDGGGETETAYADDDLTGLLLAVTAGAGIQYPLGPVNLVAEVRGFYSFTSFQNKDVYVDAYYPLAVMAMVGVSLPLPF